MNVPLTNDDRHALCWLIRDGTNERGFTYSMAQYKIDGLIRKGLAEQRQLGHKRWDTFLTEEGTKVATVLEVMES